MFIYIADVIPIIIAFQCILFAIVLFTDSGPKMISNRYLAVFLIMLGLQFTAITIGSFNSKIPFIEITMCAYGFAYGPLLFLYSNSLIYKSFQFRINHLLHFTPFIAIILITIFGYSSCGKIGIIMYISLTTYTILAIIKIVSYRNILKKTHSFMGRVNLVWLQWTFIIFCCALILDIFDHIFLSVDIYAGISSVHLTILILINWIFYKGLKQPQLFLGISELEQEIFKETHKKTSYDFPDSDEQEELEKIQKYMEDTEIYTDFDLNLKDLSEALKISPRRLSFLINTYFGKNFMSFVNEYRIKKAMFRLANPEDEGETILEIMYEVGFNSKSSFNTLFKKQTGFTPSEYKKRQTKM